MACMGLTVHVSSLLAVGRTLAPGDDCCQLQRLLQHLEGLLARGVPVGADEYQSQRLHLSERQQVPVRGGEGAGGPRGLGLVRRGGGERLAPVREEYREHLEPHVQDERAAVRDLLQDEAHHA